MAFNFATLKPVNEEGVQSQFDYATLVPVGAPESTPKQRSEERVSEVFVPPEEPVIEVEQLPEVEARDPVSQAEALTMFDEAVVREEEQIAEQKNSRETQDIMTQLRTMLGDSSVLGDMIDKTLARSTTHPDTLASFWGEVYQSESDPAKMKKFVKDQAITLQQGVEKSLNKALKVFEGDKKSNTGKLKNVMIAIAKHESLGGKKLVQGSGGPARGAWQVEPTTALDVLDNSGLIGPKAEKLLGKTKEEIRQLTEDELKKFLKDHTVNAVFATAKVLQAADAKGRLDFIQ